MQQIVERLRAQAADARRLTSGLEEADLARRVVEGKWSLKELVCHLWRVQQVLGGRIERMLAEDNPAMVSYNPEGDAEFDRMMQIPARPMMDGFVQDRETLAALLASLEAAQWRRKGRHPEYPNYDVAFQAEYLMHHEAHHLYQMYQRRALLGPVPQSI